MEGGRSPWQPWSLRDLVTDLDAGRTTVEATFGRCRERVAKTEPEIEAPTGCR